MAITLHQSGAAQTGDAALYGSLSIDLGATPKAIIVTTCSAGSGVNGLVSNVLIAGIPLKRKVHAVDTAGEPGFATAWILESADFVENLSGSCLVEVFANRGNASIGIAAYVINADDWLQYVASGVAEENQDDPSILLTIGALVSAWACGAVHYGVGGVGDIGPAAGFTEVHDQLYVGGFKGNQHQRITNVSAGGNITVGWVTSISDDIAAAAIAVEEIASGTAPEIFIPFVGHVGAAANFASFSGLIDQNNAAVVIEEGDLEIVYAVSVGDAGAIPDLPVGYTNIITGTSLGVGNDVHVRAAYRILDGDETTTGVFTNADEVQVQVYRYKKPVTIVGASANSSGTGTSASIPALSLAGDDLSLVVWFAAHSSATTFHQVGLPNSPPSIDAKEYFINRSAGHAATRLVGGDSNSLINDWIGYTTHAQTSSSLWIGTSIELLGVLPPSVGGPWKIRIVSGSLPPGLTLDEDTGIISGTPTTEGTYEFSYAYFNNNTTKDAIDCQITVQSVASQIGLDSPDLTWSFDLKRFKEGQQIIWHKYARVVKRPFVTEDDILFYVGEGTFGEVIDEDPESETYGEVITPGTEFENVVFKILEQTIGPDGEWSSPSIHRNNRIGDLTLNRVIFKFEAGGAGFVEVWGSGNGGINWEHGLVDGFTALDSNGSVRDASVYMNITGGDCRVKFKLPEGALVIIKEIEIHAVVRGEL